MANSKKTKITITKEEFEKIVVDMEKKGMTTEKIGQELKNKHGIFKTDYPVKLSKLLKEKKQYASGEIKNLKKIIERLKKHLEKHKHDYGGRISLVKKEAKLRKLEAK